MVRINVDEFMARRGLTDSDLDRMAAPHEEASFKPEPGGKAHSGSHLDEVSKPGAEAARGAKIVSPGNRNTK